MGFLQPLSLLSHFLFPVDGTGVNLHLSTLHQRYQRGGDLGDTRFTYKFSQRKAKERKYGKCLLTTKLSYEKLGALLRDCTGVKTFYSSAVIWGVCQLCSRVLLWEIIFILTECSQPKSPVSLSKLCPKNTANKYIVQFISSSKPIGCLLKIRAAGLVRWLCCACVRAWPRVEEKQLQFGISGHFLPCHHLVIVINTPVLFVSKQIHTIPTIAHSQLSATFLSEPEWVAK